MEKFEPDLYLNFRPTYPTGLFSGARQLLIQNRFAEPFSVADVGCGVGHASWSLCESGWRAHCIGIEPDPEMISAADSFWREKNTNPDFHWQIQKGNGENTGLRAQSVDYAMVASAFHWMDREAAAQELARILKPNAILQIFEYQFPKALELPTLNEWIRRQFNLHWKAPEQKPRGSLKELTQVFREKKDFRPIDESPPPMILSWSVDELAGFLFSQSRVQHFVQTLSDPEKQEFSSATRAQLQNEMGSDAWKFDFKLTSFSFQRVESL